MSSGVLVLIRKTGRIGKHCVGASKLGSPLIHHLYKAFHRACKMFGNLQGDVIGRYQHNSVQTLLHGKNFIKIGGNIGSAVSNAGNAGSSHGNLICKLAVFQCQKSCHDLYRTSGKKLLIHIFCVDNGIGGFFHNNCGCGSDISSLGPARNSVGGNSGSCLGGSDRCWKHQGKSHSQGKKPGA